MMPELAHRMQVSGPTRSALPHPDG